MPGRLSAIAKFICAVTVMSIGFAWQPATAGSADALNKALTRQIPKRRPGAPTGSQFSDRVSRMDGERRELAIEDQLLGGNIPDFLRTLKPIRLQKCNADGRTINATIFVMPDYLAVGSTADFIRIPVSYHTACRVAARFGFVLPTRRMVDAVYAQSAFHFTPQPMTPGPQMRSTDYYRRHNQKINQQRLSCGIALGALVSGHKKDVVISNRLTSHPGRIAIYGWHRPDGHPIQPLSTVHGAGYADYSHGIRLVSGTMLVDGRPRSVVDVLRDPRLAGLLTDEGPMTQAARLLELPSLSAALPRPLSSRLN